MSFDFNELYDVAKELDKFSSNPMEILSEALKKEREKAARVEPVAGEDYWYLNSMGFAIGPIVFGDEETIGAGVHRVEVGNTFKNAESAVRAREILLLRHLLLRFGGRDAFDPNRDNYEINLSRFDANELMVTRSAIPSPFAIYFDTYEKAEAVVKSLKEKTDFDFEKMFIVNREDEETEVAIE